MQNSMIKPLALIFTALIFCSYLLYYPSFPDTDLDIPHPLQPPIQLHPYHSVNLNKPQSSFEFASHQLTFGSQADYEIHEKLGKGKFGQVYLATHIPTGEKVAFKLFLNTTEAKVLKEINILQQLKNAPNFLPIRDIIKEVGDDGIIRFATVFDYFEAKHYRTLFPMLNKTQVKTFIYKALQTLEYAHRRGIMHRDIKPLNVMMNENTMEVKVIDWGHSDFYFPEVHKSVRVASLHFKSPELLLNYTVHDYSLDMWSTGCLLAEMVFLKMHFFQSDVMRPHKSGRMSKAEAKMLEFRDHLDVIASVMGSEELREYAERYPKQMDLEILKYVGNYPKVPLKNFINEQNKHLVDDEVIDLLDKMLVYDHTKRLTAHEALQHPYFDEVRNEEAEMFLLKDAENL